MMVFAETLTSILVTQQTCGGVVLKLLQTVIFTLHLQISLAYPGGAPDMACFSMFPSGHSSSAQSSDPPYKVHVPKTTYKPGETIAVDIYGDKTYFTGLLVQARHIGCHVNRTRTIGVFTTSDTRLETRHCFGIVHSAVSHISSVRKDSVSIYWTAPVVPSGHVVIRATIVKDKSTFWTGVDSTPLIDLHSNDTVTCEHLLPTHSLNTNGHEHSQRLNSDQNQVAYREGTMSTQEGDKSSSQMLTHTSIPRSYMTLLVLLSSSHFLWL